LFCIPSRHIIEQRRGHTSDVTRRNHNGLGGPDCTQRQTDAAVRLLKQNANTLLSIGKFVLKDNF